ncbi:MAG: tripartite tricarboxylate transporter substrate binding protein [Betaproteobacteria bacterium]|nr:tripartite tricarboxylate transporter substrate binding protein [Betaproteobacteria bacterium]
MAKTAYKALGLLAAFVLCLGSGTSSAQGFPNKPIKLVVGFAPGGGTDIRGRIIAQKLPERLGVPVTVDNRPGANGNIASEQVAKSAADGYTLLVGGSATMVLSAGLYERLPFDPLKDFVPVAQIVAGDPVLIAVNPSLPANSIKELIALAKSKPGQLFYASGAAPFQVAGELFNKQAGTNIVHVPFKGAAGAVTATVGGQTQVIIVSIASGLSQFQSGKLRPLAVTGSKRDRLFPHVPTLKEAGLEDVEVVFWTGLFAPAATPAPIIDKLYNEVSAVLKSDFVKERFESLGYEAGNLTPAEFRRVQQKEIEYWTKVIRQDLRIRLE